MEIQYGVHMKSLNSKRIFDACNVNAKLWFSQKNTQIYLGIFLLLGIPQTSSPHRRPLIRLLLTPANALEDVERRLAQIVAVLELSRLGPLARVHFGVVQMAQLGQHRQHHHPVVVVFQRGVPVEGGRRAGVPQQGQITERGTALADSVHPVLDVIDVAVVEPEQFQVGQRGERLLVRQIVVVQDECVQLPEVGQEREISVKWNKKN